MINKGDYEKLPFCTLYQIVKSSVTWYQAFENFFALLYFSSRREFELSISTEQAPKLLVSKKQVRKDITVTD